MGLKEKLESNPEDLEKLNLKLHEIYREDKEYKKLSAPKEAFSENKALSSEINTILTKKEELLKKADERFGKKTRTEEKEKSKSSSYASTSKKSYGSSSYGSGYGSSSLRKMNLEERVAKLADNAMKTAKEAANDPTFKRLKRRRKRSLGDKLFPHGSRRKRAAIIGSAILIEASITGLVYVQAMAKMNFHRRIEENYK